jgi:hypothetical protein
VISHYLHEPCATCDADRLAALRELILADLRDAYGYDNSALVADGIMDILRDAGVTLAPEALDVERIARKIVEMTDTGDGEWDSTYSAEPGVMVKPLLEWLRSGALEDE